MTDSKDFLDIVNVSETLGKRYAELVEKVVEDARVQGVTLDPLEAANIREVRTATMGAPLDEEALHNELMALPAMSDSAMRRAIEEGDEKLRAEVVDALNENRFNIHPDRWTDNASRRLARARELGVATPAAATPEPASTAARLEALSQMPPQTRMAMARKWGLV